MVTPQLSSFDSWKRHSRALCVPDYEMIIIYCLCFYASVGICKSKILNTFRARKMNKHRDLYLNISTLKASIKV